MNVSASPSTHFFSCDPLHSAFFFNEFCTPNHAAPTLNFLRKISRNLTLSSSFFFSPPTTKIFAVYGEKLFRIITKSGSNWPGVNFDAKTEIKEFYKYLLPSRFIMVFKFVNLPRIIKESGSNWPSVIFDEKTKINEFYKYLLRRRFIMVFEFVHLARIWQSHGVELLQSVCICKIH